MFEVGFSEILLISVIALVVLGPEKLPRLAAQVGRWMGKARTMARQFREQLEEEVQVAETHKSRPPEVQPVHSTTSAAGAAAADASTTAESAPPPMYSDPTGYTPPPEVAAAEADHAAHTHDASAETAHADNPNAPAPEPESSVYQPPAYAQPDSSASPSRDASNGQPSAAHGSAVESSASHHHDDDPPRRPGDFITHTHERGI